MTKLQIDLSIEIPVHHVKLIKLSKFECKLSNRSKCCDWVMKYESVKRLKFEEKILSRWKCWNFSAKCKSLKRYNLRSNIMLNKMMQFEWKCMNRFKCWNWTKLEIHQSVKSSVYTSIKMFKFECKISNRSNWSDKSMNR